MNEPERFPEASLQKEANRLMPGLPDCVVLDCILPRVPWYARALLKVTSKAWKHALREPHAYSELSRRAQGTKLPTGFVMLHHASEEATLNSKRRMPRPHAISIFEKDATRRVTWGEETLQPMCSIKDAWTWRKLPPIPAFAPLRILHDCGIACVNGKIFVMGGWDPRTDAVHRDVYMLNIAAGLWEWEAMPPMHFSRAFFHCTSMANKIYIVGGTSSPYNPNPEVFNVDTHTWALLPRVGMSRGFHFNGLSLVKGGNLLLCHGFCTTERGELISFRRAYDPVVGMWSDYECVEDVKDDSVSKFDDGRYIASKWDDEDGARESNVSEYDMHVVAQRTSGVIMSVMIM